jgi:hypothetical protein
MTIAMKIFMGYNGSIVLSLELKLKFPIEPRYHDRKHYILSDINVRQPLFMFHLHNYI